MRLFFCLSAIVVLSGCLKTDQPIDDPDTAVVDPRLQGFWSTSIEEEQGKFAKMIAAIAPGSVAGNPKGLICIQGLGINAAGKIDDGEVTQKCDYAVTKTIGDYGYLCIIKNDFSKPMAYAEWKKAKTKDCELYRYKIDGDRLTIWVGNEKKLAASGLAVKTSKGVASTSTITATREALIAYLKTNSDKLFDGEVTFEFKRVKL